MVGPARCLPSGPREIIKGVIFETRVRKGSNWIWAPFEFLRSAPDMLTLRAYLFFSLLFHFRSVDTRVHSCTYTVSYVLFFSLHGHRTYSCVNKYAAFIQILLEYRFVSCTKTRCDCMVEQYVYRPFTLN